MTTNAIDLTTGSIPRHLIRMTIPMIWGILAIISFQLVDAYYISLLGTHELASVSYTFPITYGIFSIFIGFGVATSSVVARLMGEKKIEDVKRITTHSLVLVFITSIIIAAIGISLLTPVFTAIGANTTELQLIRDFMVPYLIGTFFISVPVVGNAALRATGDAVRPALIMILAAVLNALINPVLIFGYFGVPAFGVAGAAIGTIFANFLAMAAGLYLMHRRGMICFSYLRHLAHLGDSAKRIGIIAIPVAVTGLLPAILGSNINHLLSDTSSAAVAAYGAITRVEAFLMVILMALSIGMGPIIGQNWGAGRMDRVKEVVRHAISFSVIWSVLSAATVMIFAQNIGLLFSDNPEFLMYFTAYMMIVPLTYVLGNLPHGWSSTFNAIGKPHISGGMVVIKTILLSIPAVWIGGHIAGVTGVFVAIAAVNCLTGIAFHLWSWGNLNNNSNKKEGV